MNVNRIIKKSFNYFGFDLVKISKSHNHSQSPSLLDRIKNISDLGFEPSIIIDGGANTGQWTKQVSNFFPTSKYILVEPNPMVSSKIKELLPVQIDYKIIEKALGPKEDNMFLNIWGESDIELAGASICNHIKGDAVKKIPCEITQLDSLASIYKNYPDLVKLDLQGFEIQALEGAKETLKYAEIFIIEFGCLNAYLERGAFNELIKIMYENSYCLYDIFDLIYRPYDNALGGGDLIFVKNNSRLKFYKDWS